MQNIENLYSQYIQGHRVTTDSRDVCQDDVFIALKGENFNGNDFALQAVEAGASVSVTDDEKYRNHPKCLWVPDTLRFLQDIASCHRHRLGIPILGITGTNGKTTGIPPRSISSVRLSVCQNKSSDHPLICADVFAPD